MKRWQPFTQTVALLVGAFLGLGLARAQGLELGVMDSPTLGSYLTAPDGMTLYIFTKDAPGVSNCYGGCAEKWPPLRVTDASQGLPTNIPGEFGTIERTDGAPQVTYNGWPLYTWVNDHQPGDTTGQAVGDVWWVANVAPTVSVANDPELGPMLVGANGMTLYLFTKDEPNKSNCYGGCAQNWPPLLVGYQPLAPEGLAGELGTVTRDDGSLQVAYNGQPLYYWVKDQLPGDTTGQGVGGVWYIVPPQ
ncbi:MAG TPA: hypothetical protein VF171_01465 [Trueperaceae bacterium]